MTRYRHSNPKPNCPPGRSGAVCAVTAIELPDHAPNGRVQDAMMVRRPDCPSPCLRAAVRNPPVMRRQNIRRHSTPIALAAQRAAQPNTFFAHRRGPHYAALSGMPVRRAAKRKTLYVVRYVRLSGMSREIAIRPPGIAVAARSGVVLPRLVADAGDAAARRFLEFFTATIRNKNTRMAYGRAVSQFFAWCDRHRIGELADIEPMHIAAYIEALQAAMAKPTVKQHLAAIRMLFDWLVTGHVVAVNPATSVHGPKHVVRRGKTTVLTADQARALLDSIDTTTLVGLRDRALISVMTFAFARIGAVVTMRVEDEPASAPARIPGRRWLSRHRRLAGPFASTPGCWIIDVARALQRVGPSSACCALRADGCL